MRLWFRASEREDRLTTNDAFPSMHNEAASGNDPLNGAVEPDLPSPIAEAVPTVRTKCRFGPLSYVRDDSPIGLSLTNYGEWAQSEINLILEFIPVGGTVVDVGANIGTHSIAFGHHVGESGQVIAFEPQPELFNLLRENVDINRLAQVTVRQEAVGRADGNAYLPKLDYSSPGNFGAVTLSHHRNPTNPDPVHLAPLDGLTLEQCHLVKIDVEGFEQEVISGMTSLVERHRPVVYVECNSVTSGVATLQAAEWADYHVFLARTDAYSTENFAGTTANVFGVAAESSILLVPSERLSDVPDGLPGVDLTSVTDEDDLARAVIETPRYGDATAFDRQASRLRSELNRVATEVEQLRSAHTDEIGRINREKIALEGELERTRFRALAHEKARTADLDLLARLQSSTSWRITEPVRRLSNAYRDTKRRLREKGGSQ